MSTPIDELQPPPGDMTQQQSSRTHSGHGSVGPFIAVLAVITILGVIAGMIGRLCSGRPIMGRGQYDVEGWAESKCSSCLDGRIAPPPPRRPPETNTLEDIPVAVPVGTPEEMKEGEEESQQQNSRTSAGGIAS